MTTRHTTALSSANAKIIAIMSSNQDPPAEVGSFESRISHPAATEEKKPEPLNDLKDIKKALEPTKIDWADDVATPTEEKKVEHEPKIKEPESNLLEPEHNVEVVLADMQSDESNPLYSAAQSFEDIQLYLIPPLSPSHLTYINWRVFANQRCAATTTSSKASTKTTCASPPRSKSVRFLSSSPTHPAT